MEERFSGLMLPLKRQRHEQTSPRISRLGVPGVVAEE